MEMRFEAWTRPESATFERLFPIRDVSDWNIQLGIFGSGSITIPSDHPHLNDILFVDPLDHANDKSSLIRAYVGDTHYYDFYAQRATIEQNETGNRTATITGGGPGTALEHTLVYPQDWDGTGFFESPQPNWEYGPQNALLSNAGFEKGLPDEDFEDESPGGWSNLTGQDPWGDDYNELNGDIQVTLAQAEGGTFSLEVPFGVSPSGSSRTVTTIPGGRIQISYKFKEPTAAGERYVIFAEAKTVHHTNGWLFNGYAFAELDAAVRGAGSTDGTWQDFDLDVTLLDDQTSITIGVSSVGSSNVTGYLDTGVYTGDGLGTDPWHPHGVGPNYMDYANVFELDSTIKHSGENSLSFQTESRPDGHHHDGPT
ncbi:hypothetical protein DRQ53_15795, partial [bacterium]